MKSLKPRHQTQSSSQMAFRNHCDYACAIERTKRWERQEKIVALVCIVLAVCLAVAVTYFHFNHH